MKPVPGRARASLFLPTLALAGVLVLQPSAEPALAAANTLVSTGSFQSKESGLVAKGAFEIREEGGKHILAVKAGFQVSEGPDLYFAFHPLAAAAVTGGNAKTGALRVEPMLRSLSGAQAYELPAGFDPSKYRSLIIHCWKFNHLYGAGALEQPPTSLGARTPLAKSRPARDARQGTPLLAGKSGAVDVSGRRAPHRPRADGQ